jgi:hypothetical protein
MLGEDFDSLDEFLRACRTESERTQLDAGNVLEKIYSMKQVRN